MLAFGAAVEDDDVSHTVTLEENSVLEQSESRNQFSANKFEAREQYQQ